MPALPGWSSCWDSYEPEMTDRPLFDRVSAITPCPANGQLLARGAFNEGEPRSVSASNGLTIRSIFFRPIACHHCTQWHGLCLTSPEEFSRSGRVRHGELKKARSGAGADRARLG